MKTPLVEYPNAHATNPYYSNPLRGGPADMNAATACGLFANAISDSYRALNARRLAVIQANIDGLISRAQREQEEAEYEKELVSLCPNLPAIPSRGPVFPHLVLPDGGIQYILPDVG